MQLKQTDVNPQGVFKIDQVVSTAPIQQIMARQSKSNINTPVGSYKKPAYIGNLSSSFQEGSRYMRDRQQPQKP